MQPNDLPIVCLPLALSGDDAATLIDFLYELAEALERHYTGQLINRIHQVDLHPPAASPSDSLVNDPEVDPPF